MGKLKLFTGCQPLLEILFAFWYASYSYVSRIFSSHRHEQDLSSQRSSVAHIVAITFRVYYYIIFSLLYNWYCVRLQIFSNLFLPVGIFWGIKIR